MDRVEEKKEKEMREGYKALRAESKSIARASKSLQKRAMSDYKELNNAI